MIPWLFVFVRVGLGNEVGYYLLIILCLSRQFLSFLKQGRSFLCHVFLTCASWIRSSLPGGCGCWTLSKPPLFSSWYFWRVLYEIICSLSFLCYFILTFSQLWVFLDFSMRMLWPCHSTERFRKRAWYQEPYPFRGSSSCAGIPVTYAVAVAVSHVVLGTGSVIIIIGVVKIRRIRRQRSAFMPNEASSLVFFIQDPCVFAAVFPVVPTTFIVFVDGGVVL